MEIWVLFQVFHGIPSNHSSMCSSWPEFQKKREKKSVNFIFLKKEASTYPEIVSLSTLIAYNAMNLP